MVGFLVVACTPPTGDRSPPPPPPTTAPPTTPVTAAIVCEPQVDNVLRYTCTATLSQPASDVTITFVERGGPARGSFASDAGEVQVHTAILWGMRAERDHDVTVQIAGQVVGTTTFRTEPLPDLLQQLTVETTGSDPVVDSLMVPLRCEGVPFLGIVDTAGAIVWYQELLQEGDGSIGMFNPTDDGGVDVIVAHDIQEWDLRGGLRLQLRDGIELDRRIHHDVVKRDGLLYTLFADTYPVDTREAVMDGIYIFDGTERIATWELYDHVTLTEADLAVGAGHVFWEDVFPGAVDFSHTNSIFVDDDAIYLSTRWLSTVWKIRPFGDPAFGDVVWRLVGQPGGPFPPDFQLVSSVTDTVGFLEQHHARIDPLGRLTLFDNRAEGDTSRVIAFTLDDQGIDLAPGQAAGTADLVEVHDLGVWCDTQGSVFTTPAGDMVATCAPTGEVLEFRAGSGDVPSFTAAIQCGDDAGVRVVMPRAVPVELPTP